MAPELESLATAVCNGDRRMLARAITLIESARPADFDLAQGLLEKTRPAATDAPSIRIGITGIPGVGKSTFIDGLGSYLTGAGHRVAVLAVDPSSTLSGGSILGDKTRMERLSRDPNAFVRPTPGGLHPGGVARRTRETMLLCEAAGFDVVLIETIGIGQSEVTVSDIVDTLVLLMLTGAGDELQGIKRGIMELADVIVIHKADGSNELPAKQAAAELESSVGFLPRRCAAWRPALQTCSSRTGAGIEEVFAKILAHRTALGLETLAANRQAQAVQSFESTVQELLWGNFFQRESVQAALSTLREQVAAGTILPTAAAAELLRLD